MYHYSSDLHYIWVSNFWLQTGSFDLRHFRIFEAIALSLVIET